jgi:alpha-glucosidase
LGVDLIVAPVIEKGARTRKLVLPEGKWMSDEGLVLKGGKTYDIEVPLSRLPYFKRVKN